MKTTFFTGMPALAHADRVDLAFVSYMRLRERKSDFPVKTWIMDSGAFSILNKPPHAYPESPEVYARAIKRWSTCGTLLAAVSQDYMCEPFMLEKTGLTVADHQRLTIERYDAIQAELQRIECDTYLLPVLQGYDPLDYVSHLHQYGDRLAYGAWVGVGSVCKRNGSPNSIAAVLLAIKSVRPDLRLHGFGVKKTSLKSSLIAGLLYTADSMAWSFAERMAGRNANHPDAAVKYTREINALIGTQAHAYQERFL